jgi:hypothetical protein
MPLSRRQCGKARSPFIRNPKSGSPTLLTVAGCGFMPKRVPDGGITAPVVTIPAGDVRN